MFFVIVVLLLCFWLKLPLALSKLSWFPSTPTYTTLPFPLYTSFVHGGVRLVPYLQFDKTQTATHTPAEVFIPSLKAFSPDDAVICPVRSLKYYMHRVQDIRGETRSLFITCIEPHQRVSKHTISGWVKSVIVDAYKAHKTDMPPHTDSRAHSTRGVAASWAISSGVPIEEIMQAADWRRQTTFADYYLRDLALNRGKFAAGVLTAAANTKRARQTAA